MTVDTHRFQGMFLHWTQLSTSISWDPNCTSHSTRTPGKSGPQPHPTPGTRPSSVEGGRDRVLQCHRFRTAWGHDRVLWLELVPISSGAGQFLAWQSWEVGRVGWPTRSGLTPFSWCELPAMGLWPLPSLSSSQTGLTSALHHALDWTV
jgi:hypothetical protein